MRRYANYFQIKDYTVVYRDDQLQLMKLYKARSIIKGSIFFPKNKNPQCWSLFVSGNIYMEVGIREVGVGAYIIWCIMGNCSPHRIYLGSTIKLESFYKRDFFCIFGIYLL